MGGAGRGRRQATACPSPPLHVGGLQGARGCLRVCFNGWAGGVPAAVLASTPRMKADSAKLISRVMPSICEAHGVQLSRRQASRARHWHPTREGVLSCLAVLTFCFSFDLCGAMGALHRCLPACATVCLSDVWVSISVAYLRGG